MKKFKFLSLILCFTLLISALTPVNAYAREAADFDFVTEYHVTTISSDEYSDHVQKPLPYKFNLNINQALVREVEIFIDDSDSDLIKVYKGDKVNFSLKTWNASRYDHWAQILVDATGTSKNFNDVSYDRSTGVYSGSYVSESDGYLSQFIFDFQTPYYISSVDPTSYKFRFDVTSFKVSIDRAQDVEQSNFFKNILNNLKDWFSSLFQWLKDIRDNITNGFSNIGTWFSDLGSKIKGFFENLTDSISTFFTNLTNKLKTWFDNVGTWFSELGTKIKGFFVDIGDRISGFFEKLWNRIWWGNENGESEYVKPVIDNKLNDIIEKLQEYQQSLQDTIATIHSSAEEVSDYIKTGTSLVNGVIGVAGAGFTALIVFGVVFVLVRKVVGR